MAAVAISGKTGNNLNTVCAQATNTYYVNDSFAIGKVIYTNVGLTVPISTAYFVNSATGLIYNVYTGAPVTVKFGVKPNQANFTQDESIAADLGCNYVRTSAVQMSNFTSNTGIGNINSFYNAGYKCITTVTWQSQNPAPFPTGSALTTFRSKLDLFLSLHGSKIEVLVIENEPTNTTFYDLQNYTIQDYIGELAAGAEIAAGRGVKVTDGCVHLEWIDNIRRGQQSGNIAVQRVKAILDATADMPNLTYNNVHSAFKSTNITAGFIPNNVGYVRDYTGHQVMSNEWHMENSSPAAITTVTNQWIDADVEYSICWDEQKKQGGALATNGVLTNLGIAYRDAIA